jgi:hypothetical protein
MASVHTALFHYDLQANHDIENRAVSRIDEDARAGTGEVVADTSDAAEKSEWRRALVLEQHGSVRRT